MLRGSAWIVGALLLLAGSRAAGEVLTITNGSCEVVAPTNVTALTLQARS